MSEPKAETDEATFESIIGRLTEVVAQLERGDLPLERSLALFEEGVSLARQGSDRLDRAEARVEELLSISEAGAKTRTFVAPASPERPR